MKKQNENRKNKQKQEDRTNQKLQTNRKTEMKSLEKKHYPFITELPKDIQKQLEISFSKTVDEQIDLMVNLSGKNIDEQQRKQMKKK